jgi:hypothetical protein
MSYPLPKELYKQCTRQHTVNTIIGKTKKNFTKKDDTANGSRPIKVKANYLLF